MSNAVKTKKSNPSSKERFCIKDCIISLVLLVALGLLVYSRLSGLAMEQWTDELLGIVGDLTILLIGMIGIFEFCYDNGMLFMVPSKFISHKEESLKKQTKEYLYGFLEEESEFLKQHEEERLAETLSMMGLSSQGYQSVKARALDARLATVKDIDTARKQLLDILFYSDVVYDLHKNPQCVSTSTWRYYIKFSDLNHNKQQNDTIARNMTTFIVQTCRQEGIDLDEIDVIMVPHSSNFLLGLTVSKILGKRFIKIYPKKKDNKYPGGIVYEGEIPAKFGKKTLDVLIVHDVLLTGTQIYESVDMLKMAHPDCRIHGLFSAVYRNVDNGKAKLEGAHNIKCYNLVELTEEDIEQGLRERGKV